MISGLELRTLGYNGQEYSGRWPIFITTFSIVSHVLSCLSINNDSCMCLNENVSFIYTLGLNAITLSVFVLNCNLILSNLRSKVFYWKVMVQFFLSYLVQKPINHFTLDNDRKHRRGLSIVWLAASRCKFGFEQPSRRRASDLLLLCQYAWTASIESEQKTQS